MKKNLFLASLCFFTLSLFGQVIDYYDEVVTDLYKEYIQVGRMPPFSYGPLLSGQVNRASNEISSSHYILNPSRNGATFSTFVSFAGHTFSKRVSIENIGEGDANNAIDYTKNYLSMPAFLAAAIDFSSEIGLGGGTQIDIRRRFTNDYFELFNISDTVVTIDNNLLTKAYLYFDNPHVSVLVGRMKTQIGLHYSDEVFFNNNIPYTDSVQLYIPFGEYFNFYWQTTNIPAVKSSFQKDVKTGNDFKDEYEDSLVAAPGSPPEPYQDYFYGFENDDFPSLLLNMYQRISFQNDFMQAGISWNIFLVSRNNRFEFADLFPFTEWHAADVIPNNIAVGLDFAIVPVQNLLFNVQLAVDEINGNTIGIGDTDLPTIWSLVGSMQNTLVIKQESLFFSTNIGYTHYLWGNFSGTSVGDGANAALSKAIYRYNAQRAMYLPYTSSYGPGAFWVSQQVIIDFAQNSPLVGLSIEPKAFLLLKEVDTNLIETVYKARTGSVAKTLYFSLEVPLSYAWRTIEASISPSLHIKGLSVPTTPWFELKLSIKAHFSASLFEKNNEAIFEFEY